MTDELAAKLLAAIETDRLTVFCGAGLSMATPSIIPSANDLSKSCAAEYCQITGSELPEAARDNLEKMAEYLKSQGQLQSFLIQRLVPWEAFRKNPNLGHEAIADFLASGVIELAVSTNYDTLIERAAETLGEPDFRAIVDEYGIGEERRAHKPLLKIHGCCDRKREETVWCLPQLTEEPLASRIPLFQRWLQQRLRGRDLLLLGFWSDWAYLNRLLEESISLIEPRNVIVVNPSDEKALRDKAPHLWDWATGSAVQFAHVQESAADFLHELRSRFSRQFLVRILEKSAAAFESRFGHPPQSVLDAIPKTITGHDLYDLRRDACGKPMGRVARTKEPQDEQAVLGTTHLYLRAKGAVIDGSKYVLDGNRIRVVHGAGKLLSMVRKEFAAEPPQPMSATMTVCVAATDDGGAPAHIIRDANSGGIIRGGTSGDWLTDGQLIVKLGQLN